MRERGGLLTVSLARASPTAALRRQHPQVQAEHTVRLSVRDNAAGWTRCRAEAHLRTLLHHQGDRPGHRPRVDHGLQHHPGPPGGHRGREHTGQRHGVRPLLPRLRRGRPPVQPHPAPPTAVPAGTFGRNRRLMLVDDDEDVRTVGASMLRRLGFLTDGPRQPPRGPGGFPGRAHRGVRGAERT